MAAIPMGRYGDTDEFGRVGAFLLSDAAAYITGATVQVDGGLIKECRCSISQLRIAVASRVERRSRQRAVIANRAEADPAEVRN